MSNFNTARFTVISGVLLVVSWLVAFLVFTHSGYPDSNDGPVKIVSYFADHRGAALAQQFFVGIAMLATVCFVGGLVSMMWVNAQARTLAVIAGIGGAAATATLLAGSAVLTALAYRTPAGDPGLMRSMLDIGYIAFNASGFAFAAFIGAASVAAMGMHVLPSWTGAFGFPVAALQIVGAATYARGDGGFSPQGWFALIAAVAVLVWVLSVCFALWRPAEAPKAAPRAPAPA